MSKLCFNIDHNKCSFNISNNMSKGRQALQEGFHVFMCSFELFKCDCDMNNVATR